ncbi:MAG: class II glutamine amidotransferase [Caldisericum sp.]|uniref:class II glutamine amidotransferase n=1 Tax=Caldisericum sp. TaxID=2499687 RepID=UPI003D1493F0
MCRILFVESNKENIETVYGLIDALVKASESDNTYGDKSISHKDGFGYILFGKNGEKLHKVYVKETNPIFESPLEIATLKETLTHFERFTFGIHVRLKSEGAIDLINTHPYMFSLPNGKNLFFMHNGTLDKTLIEDEFSFNVPENVSDSFTFSYAISRNFKNISDLKELIKNGTKFVKENSGFNTITFLLDHSKIDAIITSYFKGKREYYKTYLIKENGLTAFMSSTLQQYLDKALQAKLMLIGDEPFKETIIILQDLLTNEVSMKQEQF